MKNNKMNIATQRVKTFKLNRLSSRVMSVYRGDSPLVSGGIKNGDVVTILGTGFGSTAPTVLLWDTVDNAGEAYDLLPDGSSVPLVGDNEDAVYYHTTGGGVTLESSETYSGEFGSRSRVYAVNSVDSTLGKPKTSFDPETQGLSKMYARFYLKDSGDPFSGSANKFFRLWDDIAGEGFRISAANHTLLAWDSSDALSFSVDDDTGGYAPDNSWVLCELWADIDNHLVESRYFNIPSGRLYDEAITLINPQGTGIILSEFGYDDGDGDSAGRTWKMSDVYVSDTRARVELCSAPDPKRALVREIQQVVEWNDTDVKFTMDALRIDPNNCWAVLLDEQENILASYQIGDPTPVEQDIRRPVSTTVRAFQTSGLSTTNGNFEFECSFLIRPNSETTLTKYRFTWNGGYGDQINFNPVANTWDFRAGSGTSVYDIPAILGGWDDDQVHTLKVVSSEDNNTVEIYVDGILDAQASVATFSPFTPYLFGYPVGDSLDGSATGYMWDVKITDTTTPSNSHYWKLDEQVVSAPRVYDYSQDREAGDDMVGIQYAYLPNEGY